MYAASKLAGDVLARSYGKTYDLPVGIARMTNSYGGDDHHVAHIITATILSALKNERPVIKQSGKDRKGYLYIKDTAQGLLAVAEGVAGSRIARRSLQPGAERSDDRRSIWCAPILADVGAQSWSPRF